MEIERSVEVDAAPSAVFPLVDDLAAYPSWMALVHDVEPLDPAGAPAAWGVELQADVGPFTRSKRLRMVRTVHRPDHRVVFERDEVDGRSHSPWVLDVRVESVAPDTSTVTMTLTYGGSLWTGAVLQRVLDDHVERGARALRRRCADGGDPNGRDPDD